MMACWRLDRLYVALANPLDTLKHNFEAILATPSNSDSCLAALDCE